MRHGSWEWGRSQEGGRGGRKGGVWGDGERGETSGGERVRKGRQRDERMREGRGREGKIGWGGRRECGEKGGE